MFDKCKPRAVFWMYSGVHLNLILANSVVELDSLKIRTARVHNFQ